MPYSQMRTWRVDGKDITVWASDGVSAPIDYYAETLEGDRYPPKGKWTYSFGDLAAMILDALCTVRRK